MRYWLMKTEPSTFGIEDLAAAPRHTTGWDGVRNYQARNMLRDEMRRGDQAFLYHSSCEVPGMVGDRADREARATPIPPPSTASDHHYDPDSDPTESALVHGRRAAQAPLWRASSRSRSCARTPAGSSRAWCCCVRAIDSR